MNAVAEQNASTTQPVEKTRHYVRPGVNISETPEAYLLEAEMPGVNKNGLNVTVEGSTLTLEGRRQAAPEARWLYRESTPADYRRIFELDRSIDASKISARIEQGILSLTLPKVEQVKPQRIAIN